MKLSRKIGRRKSNNKTRVFRGGGLIAGLTSLLKSASAAASSPRLASAAASMPIRASAAASSPIRASAAASMPIRASAAASAPVGRLPAGNTIAINCQINPSDGTITVGAIKSSLDPFLTATSKKPNTLTITPTVPIKNIQFCNASSCSESTLIPISQVGSFGNSKIHIMNMKNNKMIIPKNSFVYSKLTAGTSGAKKIDAGINREGMEISNLNAGNLGLINIGSAAFTVLLTL
jgi:hypothetical protein